jgi:pimeloyl-ACP methyl ester carboxylesterase
MAFAMAKVAYEHGEDATSQLGSPASVTAEPETVTEQGSRPDDRRRRLRRLLIGEFSAKRVLISLAEVYLCVLVWAVLFSDHIIFQPPHPSYTEGQGVYRIAVSQTEKIGVLELPNPDARYTVLYAHGNAEDLGSIRSLMEWYRNQGFSCYAFDYRGYGISDGKPSTLNAYADTEAAFSHLVNDKGIAPNRIIVHGRSLGAAFAIHLASKYEVAGLIVESGFVTAFRAVTQIPISPFDKMRNGRRIREVSCPVLVMHGESDRVIPFWHGKRLFELAPEPKLAFWVPRAGHNDFLFTAGSGYWEQIHGLVKLIESRGNKS